MAKRILDAVGLCEGYLPAKMQVQRNRKEILTYKKKLEADVTEFERMLLEDCIQEKLKECQESQWKITLFDIAFRQLDKEERSIIKQIYNDGRKWRDITWSDGRHMSMSTVSDLRKRAMRKITAFLVRRGKI